MHRTTHPRRKAGTSGKRFCYIKFASPYTSYGYRDGAPYQEAIFSLEWTNEASGKFWLQVVKQHDYRDPNFDYSKFFEFAPDSDASGPLQGRI